MNGIEKIIEHIKAESTAECQAISKSAEDECSRIQAEFKQAEQDEYWKAMTAGKKEADLRLERLNSLAALESKKKILVTQQQMIAETFEFAAKKILNLPETEYITLLAKLACKASLSGHETIYLSASDYSRIGQEVLGAANYALQVSGKPASLTLSDKTLDIRGGLVLSDGDIEVNCSIDALVAQCRNDLSPRVADALFD